MGARNLKYWVLGPIKAGQSLGVLTALVFIGERATLGVITIPAKLKEPGKSAEILRHEALTDKTSKTEGLFVRKQPL